MALFFLQISEKLKLQSTLMEFNLFLFQKQSSMTDYDDKNNRFQCQKKDYNDYGF